MSASKLLNPEHKTGGVLAPVFALCGSKDLGIGDVGALGELVDWAAGHGLGFVQVLPVNLTGGDHSPYNLLDSMALEPLTVSCAPEHLPDVPRRLFSAALKEAAAEGAGSVFYPAVVARKWRLLRAAAEKFAEGAEAERLRDFQNFCRREADWLEPHALHQVLVARHGTEVITQWPVEHRRWQSARQWAGALEGKEKDALEWELYVRRYVQWVAWTQWHEASRRAAEQGVALIGDVPVGVSLYSADVWAHPELFDCERSSGAPPEKVFKADPFTEQWGQNWGFPLYNWREMARDNFYWWRRRLRALGSVFAMLRIDHALGFFRIYSFPWRPERNAEFTGLSEEEARRRTGGKLPGFVPNDDDTEEHRAANKLHGETLLGMLAEELGAQNLIAEDLGQVAPYVRPVLARLGMPGFKIPQWERSVDGRFLPGESYPRVSIATYATHDHPPLKAYWNTLVEQARGAGREAEQARKELEGLLEFCGEENLSLARRRFDERVLAVLLRGLWACNSWLAAVGLNDLFGTELRFNVPGTAGQQNWSARIPEAIAKWNKVYAGPIRAWEGDLRQLRPWPPRR